MLDFHISMNLCTTLIGPGLGEKKKNKGKTQLWVSKEEECLSERKRNWMNHTVRDSPKLITSKLRASCGHMIVFNMELIMI